jgi:hypothetical protein
MRLKIVYKKGSLKKSWYLLTLEIFITECNTWYECNFSTKSVQRSVGNYFFVAKLG